MTALEEARDAVANAITAKAKGDTIEVSAEAIGKLAHAVSEMEFGPDGGVNRNTSETDYRYTSDHTSRHEKPESSGAGFASGAVAP